MSTMANLYIKTGFKEGKSYLMDSYVSVPFRITNVGQIKDDDCLYMMLGSSSPGLLDTILTKWLWSYLIILLKKKT